MGMPPRAGQGIVMMFGDSSTHQLCNRRWLLQIEKGKWDMVELADPLSVLRQGLALEERTLW